MLHTAINRARQVRRNGQAGFTLIELLIVIVILGVLASIVVFSVKGITNHGEVAACKAEVSTIATAEEAYYANQTAATPTYGTIAQLQSGGFLRPGTPKYVASASATDGSLTMTGSAPCTAA